MRRLGFTGKIDRQRGLSIIELMVGVAIGLFIVAGGSKLLADGLVGNRRVIIESRLSQDLRSATDIIARDLRRAGYWGNALAGATPAVPPNNYRQMQLTELTPATGTAFSLEYGYSRDVVEDDVITPATEQFGFDREIDGNNVGRIRMRVNNAYQPLTDPGSVNVTDFQIVPVRGEISLGNSCRNSLVGTPCCRPDPDNAGLCKPASFESRPSGGRVPAAGEALNGRSIDARCPELVIRRFEIIVIGRAPAPNQDIRREIRETVRVRNDLVDSPGWCP